MAYFGRKPKKPGSTPGAGSGSEFQATLAGAKRVARAVRRFNRGREERPEASARALRMARTNRAEREAR